MIEVKSIGGLDMETLINEVSADYAKSDIEEKKITKARIQIHTEKIQDKRAERIKNLIDQIKGASGGGGACFKVLKVVFKVVDFLTKPLSLFTLNKLKTDLSKTLEMLKDANNQQKLLGFKIKGQEILKSMQDLKTLLSDDMLNLKTQDDRGAKETERILRILNEIETTFQATNQV